MHATHASTHRKDAPCAMPRAHTDALDGRGRMSWCCHMECSSWSAADESWVQIQRRTLGSEILYVDAWHHAYLIKHPLSQTGLDVSRKTCSVLHIEWSRVAPQCAWRVVLPNRWHVSLRLSNALSLPQVDTWLASTQNLINFFLFSHFHSFDLDFILICFIRRILDCNTNFVLIFFLNFHIITY